MPRTILHLDLDAFFCAVEEQRDPSLAGKAFAVGGRPEERGVVASCSYPARACGVRSAMPTARALRLCPDLILIPGHHRDYSRVSREVMARLGAVTPLLEQVSIDEAFLDVTGLPETGEAIARAIQEKIQVELSLPCSLGVASNKLVAKIANDVGKKAAVSASRESLKNTKPGQPRPVLGPERPVFGPPRAIMVVPPGQEAEFLAHLPVEALWGVGPKTAAQLNNLGLYTIEQLAGWPEEDLVSRFGKNGHDLARRARGIDDSPLITEHEAKSISQETTFARDVRGREELLHTLQELSEGVGRHLRKDGLACQTVRLKLRWPDFTTLSRQVTLDQPTDQDADIYAAALSLFEKVWKPGQSVRLLGVGGSSLGPPVRQLGLWDTQASDKSRRLQTTLDTLRKRFGSKAIVHASEIKKDESSHR